MEISIVTCPCRPWDEIVAAVEGDVVAMGLPAEMGESSVMQLVGKGCAVECPQHPGRFKVAEKARLFQQADDLTRAYRMSAVKCPLCYEGRVTDGVCGLCEGSGYVTYQQLILEEARRSVTGWLNDAFSPEKSMARWADLRRYLRGVVVAATGVPSIAGGAYQLPPMLQLVDRNGQIQAELRGVNWGYNGNGSRALAIILSDALPERFESYDAALAFAESVPQEDHWTITPP